MEDSGNTSFDPSGLLVKINGGLTELYALEGDNVSKAVEKIFREQTGPAPQSIFDYFYLIELHRDMFGEVWDWAGKIRRCDLNLGIAWQHVDTQLFELVRCVALWTDQTLLEQCARLHHRLAQIHPFKNGNGRWSRLAADVWSLRNGGGCCEWPSQFAGTKSPLRDAYIAAMKDADTGDLQPLIAIHATLTPQS